MPRTEAGIQLERDHFDAADYCGITRPYLSDAIDAIEAETVAAERERITAAVEAQIVNRDEWWPIAAALAIVNPEAEK